MRRSTLQRRIGRALLVVCVSVPVVMQAGAGRALDQAGAERVAATGVQLGVLYSGTDKDTGKPFQGTFPWGNGTFVSASGYILTTATTANVGSIREEARKDGIDVKEGVLVVSIAKTIADIPAPAYLAKVVAVDETADLALLQVSTDLSGKAVTAGSVSFPPLAFGNADSLKIGDKVTAIGFPASDDTASYSTRSVQTFAKDQAFAGRSVIGLDSAMPSGFVGSAAVDTNGKLIGVAAFGAGPPPAAPATTAPCTPTVDTNRDGRVDANDTCAPPDPGIGSLRSSNAVLAFFSTLSGGSSGGSSGGATTTTTTPPISPFPAPVPSTTLPGRAPTTLPGSGPVTPAPLPRPTLAPSPVPTTAPRPASTPSSVPPAVPTKPTTQANDVYLYGYVYDSSTGRPVTDGYVFLHKPGTDIRKGTDDDVIASFKIDKNGKWGFPSYRWVRGENYPIAVYSEKYTLAWSNDFTIAADAPDPLRMDIQLDPK